MKKILLVLLGALLLTTATRAARTNDTLQKKYWINLLKNVSLTPDLKPIRYQENIRLELKGSWSKRERHLTDSIVSQLNTLITSCSVQQVSKNGNLVLEKGLGQDYGERKHIVGNRISYRIVGIPNTTAEYDYDRLLSRILSSLVLVSWHTPFFPKSNIHFKDAMLSHYDVYYSQYEDRMVEQFGGNKEETLKLIASIDTSGFKEGDVIFTAATRHGKEFAAADQFIIKTIYSNNADVQIKEAISTYIGTATYYRLKHNKAISVFEQTYPLLLKLLLATVFLAIFYRRNRNQSLLSYLLLGSSLFILYSIIQDIVHYPNTDIKHVFSSTFILLWIAVMVVSGIMFGVNRLLRKMEIKQWQKDAASSVALFVMVALLANLSMGLSAIEHQQLLAAVVAIIITTGYHLLSRLVFMQQETIRLKDEELSRLQVVKAQTELQALQSKLNPHFLYNALNSLSHLIKADADKAEKMTLQLSDLFRYTLSRDKRDFVELREELEMTNKYLEVEKMRFGERLNVSISTNEDANRCLIPRLTIQPLVENAIKHGISKITGEGYIRITVQLDASSLTVSVEDNGPAFPDTPTGGVGLQSISERLQLLYGSEAELSWSNQPSKRVSITIPKKRS